MKLKSLTRTVLPNGLPVYVGQTPDSASFEIAMQIDTGSRDETKETKGLRMMAGTLDYAFSVRPRWPLHELLVPG